MEESAIGLEAVCKASQVPPQAILVLIWTEILGVSLGGALLWLALKCLSNVRVLGAVRARERGTKRLSSG